MTPERARLLEAVAEAAEGWRMRSQTTSLAREYDLINALSALHTHDAASPVVGEMRKIIQVSTAFDRGDGFGEYGSSYQPAMVTTVLCSDGTLWWKHHHESPWVQHQPIPSTVEEAKR